MPTGTVLFGRILIKRLSKRTVPVGWFGLLEDKGRSKKSTFLDVDFFICLMVKRNYVHIFSEN